MKGRPPIITEGLRKEARKLVENKKMTPPQLAECLQALYNVHRTTIYQHLNDDPTKYRHQSKVRLMHPRLEEIELLRRGSNLNTLQISEKLGIPLEEVNEAIRQSIL